jgi:hypothetical protein
MSHNANTDRKAHHFVPRAYLRGFTVSRKKEQIWVYEEGQRSFCTNIKNAGVETDYYSTLNTDGSIDRNTIEIGLEKMFERPGNAVIKSLRARLWINHDQKVALARYMSILMTRVPKHRARVAQIYPEILAAASAQFDAEFDRASAEKPDQREQLEARRQQVRTIIEGHNVEMPQNMAIAQISDKYANVLQAMTWIVFQIGGPQRFLTSDNPIFFFPGVGLVGQIGSRAFPELTFPISKTLALWATWRPYVEGFVPANEAIVREINRRTVASALRYVYAPIDAPWVEALVNDKPNLTGFWRIFPTNPQSPGSN